MSARAFTLPSFTMWTGCYTADANGSGEGVGVMHVTGGVPAWSHTAAVTDSPSFLALHPGRPVLYAVGEAARTFRAYRIDDTDAERLHPFGEVREAGDAVCHVAVDPRGRFAVACCWGDGQVICYPLDEEGGIAGRIVAPAAVDPYAGDPGAGDPRAAEPAGSPASPRPSRAHCALMLADGRVATTDLGYDLVRFWRYEPGVGLVPDHEVVLPEGSEPRHLVQHPSGRILVVGEVSVTVFTLEADADGRHRLASRTPVLAEGAQDGDTVSEISLESTGRFVLVSVRGRDVIATLTVHDDGARLEPAGSVPCGGATPRHHLQLGELLLVANQGSSSVTAFRLDGHTGAVAEQIAEVPVGSPSCLLPA